MEKEKVMIALKCRAQDFMNDPSVCDGCDYQIQIVRRMGCDYRRIYHDAYILLKEQENKSKRNPVIVCPHCGKRVK